MVNTGISIWSGEIVALLKTLHADGKSGSQIAEAITAETGVAVTRNMVIGKASRLGLAKKKTTASIVAHDRRVNGGAGPLMQKINRIRRGEAPKLMVEHFEARTVPLESRSLTILQIGPGECRWGDQNRNADGLHTFCGHPTASGSSYCAAHTKLSWGPGTASERAAVKALERAAA